VPRHSKDAQPHLPGRTSPAFMQSPRTSSLQQPATRGVRLGITQWMASRTHDRPFGGRAIRGPTSWIPARSCKWFATRGARPGETKSCGCGGRGGPIPLRVPAAVLSGTVLLPATFVPRHCREGKGRGRGGCVGWRKLVRRNSERRKVSLYEHYPLVLYASCLPRHFCLARHLPSP
jgi:hypothetical protein